LDGRRWKRRGFRIWGEVRNRILSGGREWARRSGRRGGRIGTRDRLRMRKRKRRGPVVDVGMVVVVVVDL